MHDPVSTPSSTHFYQRIPLFVKILVGLVAGIIAGLLMGPNADGLKPIATTVLKLLRFLATPLIFSAVLSSLISARIEGKKAAKLMWVLMSNTVVAICIGLGVANLLQPGQHISLEAPLKNLADKKPYSIVDDLLGRIPGDFISGFKDNEIIGVLFVAVILGLAIRSLRSSSDKKILAGLEFIENLVHTFFGLAMVMLKWVFEIIPLAVFAVVAGIASKPDALEKLRAMGWFVGAVLLALALMALFYLIRLTLTSWVRPGKFIQGGVDAFVMAFSTASSAATLPITYKSATEKIGVREESASLGIMVGGTFNHDGTALYEAMAALFIAQGLHQHLDVGHQVIVVIMAVIASVGAAGIPEAGLVTMLAVFTAVKLPTEYIVLLLPLDWFLDRCRTTINVMGDLASTCIIDGKTQSSIRVD